jgi:hypothetical protein
MRLSGSRRRVLALAACGIAVLAVAGTANAVKVTVSIGDIVVHAEGGVTPKRLPRDHFAPVEIHGGGKVSTKSGAYPPVIEDINLEFDKHGSVVTTGLPVCTAAKLQATTVPVARRNCPGAIVGKGSGRGVVVFPEQAPIPVSSPITLFNGRPKGGEPTVLAHAHLTQPVPTTFVITIVIERIHRGIYGYRTKTTIPRIADGAGIPVSGSLRIGRKWTVRGRRYSYVNARCETGRLQARGEFGFEDGTLLSGTFLRPCIVRDEAAHLLSRRAAY